MRPYLAITLAIIIVVGFAAKMFFFPKPPAEAQLPATASMDVIQLHLDHPTIRDLPEQSVKEPF